MKYKILFVLIVFSLISTSASLLPKDISESSEKLLDLTPGEIWESSDFRELISLEVFEMAMNGYKKHTDFKEGKITIIDFSKPSTLKRFFVIDLQKKSLLFSSLVAHGQNTGANNATQFSNKPNSHKSSLGFYRTAETYNGKHGYSLRLDGLEPEINDNARSRAIVIHGAEYVSKRFINENGRLGRSWGCPALPNNTSSQIIDAISDGTCLFIFGVNEGYLASSGYLK